MALGMTQIVHNATWAHNRPLPEIRWSIDVPQFLVFHDRDVSVDITAAERLLTSLGPGIRYMTANEYSGYLHARAGRDAASEAIAIEYDEHYCRYFADHTSTWVLHLSDETLNAHRNVPEKRTVVIPKGTGRHLVRLLE
jgi:hypothetical protein